VRAFSEQIGRRIIRAEMPEQHRTFFAGLTYAVLGGLDANGWPRATIVSGAAGFLHAPAPQALVLAKLPPEDDMLQLEVGAPLALLGIDLETRRRNRANGVITTRDAHKLTMQVHQSFGNCPQYIQVRKQKTRAAVREATRVGSFVEEVEERAKLSAPAIKLLARADTLFVASASRAPTTAGHGKSTGVDVSHRGGRPGFVTVESCDARTFLEVPDFAGNNLFNTLGNLVTEPRAGLVIPDFETGDLLSLAVRAEVLWCAREVAGAPHAERSLRLEVVGGMWLSSRIDAEWSSPEFAREL
jgi:hypothetical protein